jgi:hypothetical protein
VVTGSVAKFLEGLSATAGIVAILIVGGLLTGCSASSRMEDIVPSWTNAPSADTPPAQPTPKYQARKQDLKKPDVRRQERTIAAPAPQATVEE